MVDTGQVFHSDLSCRLGILAAWVGLTLSLRPYPEKTPEKVRVDVA